MAAESVEILAGANALPNVQGTASVLVILAYASSHDSTTPSQAANQVGGVDNAWYQDTSYGQLGLSAVATPWVQIPPYNCDNDFYAIASSAEQAATAIGYTPSAYDHEMIYIPATGCSWAGRGQVGGRITEIYGYMDTRVTVHELGHNLGLWHSHSRSCTSGGTQVPDGGSCSFDEYGDPFDAMGNGFYGVGHFNAEQKDTLGWLSGETQTVNTTTTLTLSPLESTTGLKAAIVSASGSFYYIEYRQPLGNDSFLTTYPGATDGVLVHAPGISGTGTDLLDETPNGSFNFFDAALRSGQTWTAPSGVTVTVNSATSTGASIGITVPTKVPDPPTNVVATAGNQSASVSWTAAADNGNPISSYTVTASPGPASVTVSGSLTSATLTGLTNGTSYTFTVVATNGVGPSAPSAPSNAVTPGGSGPPIEAPSTGFAFPASLGTSSIPVVEKWAKASDPNGICSYDLRESVAGGPFNEVTLGSATATSVSLSLNPSTSYGFELNVTNCLGQSSGWGMQPTFSPLVWQESSTRLTYTGTWKTHFVAGSYGGALKSSTSAGSSVSGAFFAEGIAWASETGPTLGKATVYIDGVAVKTVDLYSATLHEAQIVWKKGWSTPQVKHTIKIVVKGTAGHPRVDLDALLTLNIP